MGRFPDFSAERDWLAALPNVEMTLPPIYSELPGLKALFEELRLNPLFERFNWVIAHIYADQLEQFHTALNHNTVMLYFSNEDFRVPNYISALAMLFTPYWWPMPTVKNLRALPLGCNGEVPALAPWPWAERDLDLFFSGHAHKYRIGFYQAFQAVLLQFRPAGSDLSALAVWSSRFRDGLDPNTYASHLARCKVACIPRGHSAMTYRLFEAMRAGCLLLTEDLPPAWYLADCPRVVMPPDWHSLGNVLQQLWQDPALMAEMHLKTLANYQNNCSPPAIAKYILGELAALDR
ncbi:MAG: glycosyltransferase [Candidatus Sericytochromatia bacterium]